MPRKLSKDIPAQVRLDMALERVHSHLNRIPLRGRQLQHLRSWVAEAAYAVFEMFPELREEGSFPRYFVARSGRRQGLRGEELSRYVEDEYSSGRWHTHVPSEILEKELGKSA